MAKELLYPHIPKFSAITEPKGALAAIYEAHNKELELMSQFQIGLLTPTEMATEADNIWRQALSKIVQARSK
jgi:hypothetical protein